MGLPTRDVLRAEVAQFVHVAEDLGGADGGTASPSDALLQALTYFDHRQP